METDKISVSLNEKSVSTICSHSLSGDRLQYWRCRRANVNFAVCERDPDLETVSFPFDHGRNTTSIGDNHTSSLLVLESNIRKTSTRVLQ